MSISRPPQTGHAGSDAGHNFGDGSRFGLGSFSFMDAAYRIGERTCSAFYSVQNGYSIANSPPRYYLRELG